MNNQFNLGFCYEKRIGISKGKEKASDSRNSVRQISSNSGRQNESINTDKDGKKVLRQIYFLTPKFKKNLIYNSPANKYQEFTNTYIYSIMMKTGNNTPNHAKACNEATQEWNKIKTKNTLEIDDIIKKYLNTSFNLYNIQTFNSITAKAHHHPAWVSVAGVSHTDIHEHPDGHYCLVFVKCTKQFASVFSDMSVVISQDDKAKIGLRIPAVGRIFHILQSINNPICVADHDFVIRFEQKLVPSIYLLMKLDLDNLTIDPQYDSILKTGREIQLISVLLVDRKPDENLRHLKNIKSYCLLFRKFNLDYLTIRTYASGQSKYNPVERGKVNNQELAFKNFWYAKEAFCNIWCHDLIFGKRVNTQYVEEFTNPCKNLQFEEKNQKQDNLTECSVLWSWIEKHCNIYQYSLNIKKYTDASCCGPPHTNEAIDFLQINNSFLSLIIKAKDEHFTNPIHLLEYYDFFKISKYDQYCLSLDEATYSQLFCSKYNKYFLTLTFLMYHKWLMHPVSHGRLKGKAKSQIEQNSMTLYDFSLLLSQQHDQILSLDEVYTRRWLARSICYYSKLSTTQWSFSFAISRKTRCKTGIIGEIAVSNPQFIAALQE
ncbi:9288_t:CDS:2, partial [Scutellospora calospora]